MTRGASVITAFRASTLAFVLVGLSASELLASRAFAFRTPAAEPAQQTPATPLRYARAKEGGTRVYNLPDTKGVQMLEARAGTLLAVYAENAGFLEVEPACGIEVWVHGKYLATTDEPGVLEVTGSGINMRPSPSSTSENSYPLSRSLGKKDKVRASARVAPDKPMSEDWVKVWAPAGTRAWCRKADTADSTEADAAALFTTAQKEARGAAKLWVEPSVAKAAAAKAEVKPAVKPAEKSAVNAAQKTPEKAQASAADLAKADALYEQARTSAAPDFTAAKAAYQKLLDTAPGTSTADGARAGLEKIALHEEITRLRSDKVAMEADRQARLAAAEQALRDASLSSDPLWGRFQARGWLEKSGERWVVRWAGKLTSEIVCSSGRYDLALFEGFQLGVIGALQRSATGELPARIDARRIEVLDGRGAK